MTEEEAHHVLCPHSADINGAWSPCIGKKCAAWRTIIIPGYQQNTYNTTERPEGDDWKPFTTAKNNTGWWRHVPERTEHYCGLAGRPE